MNHTGAFEQSRILASSRAEERTEGRMAPTGCFRGIWYWGLLRNSYRENPNQVETGQKYRTLQMTTSVRSVVAGDIKSKYKRSVRVKFIRLLG